MFDDSFAQSKMYFQLLHLLRIVPLWIRETGDDLQRLKSRYYKDSAVETSYLLELESKGVLARGAAARSAEIVRQNWENLLEDFSQLEEKLLRRIGAKTDEIRGLRDGVDNSRPPTTISCG